MKFREFETSSGKRVLAGKDAESNEELVKKFKGKNNVILHTEKPGSPFCVFTKPLLTCMDDVKEATIFCAKKSQDWRDNKSDVEVHWFKGRDVYKEKGMKVGTFGVRKFKVIKVKKREIEKFAR